LDGLPKVSIGIIGVVILQIGGFIWWTAQQASTISNLESTVSQLSAQSEVQDKVNMQRDILANSMRLDDIDNDLSDLWDETEMIWEDVGGMADHMMQIIKLQSRIAILEKTLEFTRKDGM
jgi:cytoskeletal protein RodZ|tara:strand:- start:30 stop:389 length:360 start_codon:yes stop_codon:yes gene_type:complete